MGSERGAYNSLKTMGGKHINNEKKNVTMKFLFK